MSECPKCGDPLYAFEEWRLRKGLVPRLPAEQGDYVHKRCYDD